MSKPSTFKVDWENIKDDSLSFPDLKFEASKRGLICEILIDQKKYVGEDPVGYGCSNRATIKIGSGDYVAYACKSCSDLIKNEFDRVTFPWEL